MDHLLRNATGHTLRVDCDLWLAILDLALAFGWRPEGTNDPDPGVPVTDPDQARWEPSAYFLAAGQRIGEDDARELAAAARRGLERVSADQVPLTDLPFGEEHTLGSILRAIAAQEVSSDTALAAMEILSGPPAKEVAAVLSFLEVGHTRVYPQSVAEVK